VYEAGKQMLVDSVSIGRDFCKFMVGVSTGAIPLYLALLQLAVPKDYRPGWGEGALEVAPGALFLAAAATFAVGMLPRRSDVSLDNVEATEALRVEVMTQRARFTYVGFALFGVAALASIVITIVALGFKPAAPAPAKPLQVQIVHP
jgi:hypothetical protein